MTDRLLQTGAWVVFAMTAGVMLINPGYMLVSPQTWFALPRWLRLKGIGTREHYESKKRNIQWRMRILGAVIVATVGWVAFEFMHTAGSK
jgi:hypothetical protein